MLAYILRRMIYAIPILIGINLITFLLFFVANSPDDIARARLGDRYITEQAVERWKIQHGYDKPLFYNAEAAGVEQLTQTLFVDKSLRLFLFDFGVSDGGRDIGYDIRQRMWASLAIAIPILLIGLAVNLTFALLMVFFRASYLEFSGILLCIILMSISSLFYVIGGQYLLSKILHLFPISGYDDGIQAWKFVVLPVLIGIVSGVGMGSRWYRTIFLEELNKDYVRTGLAKGLSELSVLFRHVLKNAMLPILTGIVVVIPTLFMGSLILESFFGIPGLGSYTIEAIQQQDFAIVRAMVFLGSVLYILGLIMTDISYTLADPRVRLS